MTTTGKHCLLDLYGCDEKTINDSASVEAALREACDRAHATLINFSSHAFEPQGVTALALLAESHLSIHTWPEKAYVAVDVFTCGSNSDPQAACALLVGAFKAANHNLRVISRGPMAE